MTVQTEKRRGSQRLKTDWIILGIQMLGESGVGEIRIEKLCERLKLTKGSFYWHFKSRADFILQVLQYWEKKETRLIINRVETRGGSAIQMLEHLFEEVNSGQVNFSAELAIRHWARNDKTVAISVQTVDSKRIEFLETLFKLLNCNRPKQRLLSTLLYSLIFGEAMIHRTEEKGNRLLRQRSSFDQIIKWARSG